MQLNPSFSGIVLLLCFVGEATAQERAPIPDPHSTSVPAMVSQFVRETAVPPAWTSNAEPAMMRLLLHRTESFADARVDSLISALVVVVATADEPHTQASAAALIVLSGSTASARPRGHIVSQARQIYESTTEEVVQRTILGLLFRVADRERAMEWLLELIVSDPADGRFPDEGEEAVRAALAFGAIGQERLRALNASGGIQNPRTAAFLDHLVEHDFRLRR